MYKVRIKHWGLTKNLRSDKVRRIQLNDYLGADADLPVVHGRVLGSKRFIQQMNATKKTRAFKPVADNQAVLDLSASPLNHQKWPKTLSEVEGCIHAVLSYTTTRFQDKSWELQRDKYKWNVDLAPSWFLDICNAQELIATQRGSAKAFQVLEQCFDRYRSLLVYQNPSLIMVTFMAILKFDGAGLSEIAISLLRYVARLSIVSFGPAHPLSRIWGLLYTVGLNQLCQAAPAIMTANLDSIRANSQPGNRLLMIATMHMARELPKYTEISEQAAHAEYTKLYQEMANNIQSRLDKTYFWSCKLFQVAMIIDNGHYTEAEAFLQAISANILNGGPYNKFTYYYHMGRTNAGLGRYYEGAACFSEALSIATQCAPLDLSAQATILAGLLASYRLLGDSKAVQEVNIQIEKTREDIVQQIKAGQFYDIGGAEMQENLAIHMDYQLYLPTKNGGRWCRAGQLHEVGITETQDNTTTQRA